MPCLCTSISLSHIVCNGMHMWTRVDFTVLHSDNAGVSNSAICLLYEFRWACWLRMETPRMICACLQMTSFFLRLHFNLSKLLCFYALQPMVYLPFLGYFPQNGHLECRHLILLVHFQLRRLRWQRGVSIELCLEVYFYMHGLNCQAFPHADKGRIQGW